MRIAHYLDADRYEKWLESTIADKRAEVAQMQGEISAYESALTVLRRFLDDHKRKALDGTPAKV